MLFEQIDEHFWKKYVYINFDIISLINLIQTNRFMYKHKKYLYKLIFPKILKEIS